MSKIQIIGFPPSSYVRTVRMACVEKGVEHELKAIAPQELTTELHPFKKVPIIRDGDFELVETQAIVRYIDAKFDGPDLMPSDPVKLAKAEQFISFLNCYAYADFVPNYIFTYVFPKGPNGSPDQDALKEAVPKLERDLGLLEKALDGNDFIAGKEISLADLFWAPVLGSVSKLPEGGKIVDRLGNVRRWLTSIEGRKSGEFVYPPR